MATGYTLLLTDAQVWGITPAAEPSGCGRKRRAHAKRNSSERRSNRTPPVKTALRQDWEWEVIGLIPGDGPITKAQIDAPAPTVGASEKERIVAADDVNLSLEPLLSSTIPNFSQRELHRKSR